MPVDLNALPLKHDVSYLKITWTSSHHRCWIRCRASSIPEQARGGNKLPSRAAGWGMERTGLKRGPAARLKKHIRRDFFSGWLSMVFFYLPLHHTTCIFSLPVHGGPATHLLGRLAYTKHHSVFHQPPKQHNTMLVLRPKTLRHGLSGGGGRQSKKIKKVDASLLP